MDCINVGPCNLNFELAQTEQDIPASWMCVKPSGTITTLKLQHQKTLHQINSWQFKWCKALHRVTSNKFTPIFLMYVMFSAQMVLRVFVLQVGAYLAQLPKRLVEVIAYWIQEVDVLLTVFGRRKNWSDPKVTDKSDSWCPTPEWPDVTQNWGSWVTFVSISGLFGISCRVTCESFLNHFHSLCFCVVRNTLTSQD